MDNKLQELTARLYEEGLSKGRSDAEKMIAEAREKADAILREARERAQETIDDAGCQADEIRRNTMTEVSLAGRQAVEALRRSLTDLVVMRVVEKPVHEAVLDAAFVKDMLLTAAASWRRDGQGKVELTAMLPADWQKKLDGETEAAVAAILADGVEVGYSDKVRSGFRLGPRDGGYYIGFGEEEFRALITEYLKDKVARMLYGEQKQ